MSNPEARAEYNRFLVLSAQELDLTPIQHKSAVEKYTAVGDWLAKSDSPLAIYSPNVFAQGSLALGTAVKPIAKNEFDIDLVCELQLPGSISQSEAKRLVGNRLKESGHYKDKLIEKNRCWRIDYADEFHMDILPAKPDGENGSPTAIVVPDKELQTWKPSDPKGYLHWFAIEKAKSLYEESMRAKGLSVEANVEPAPEQDGPGEKTPLQVAVQVLKRHRDEKYGDDDDAPISIIITTLAGQSYEGQGDALSTMEHLLDAMPKQIKYRNGVAYIENPTNKAENFADKWQTHPNREKKFFEWIDAAKADLRQFVAAKLTGIENPLSKLVGKAVAQAAIRRYAESLDSSRGSSLRVDIPSGILGATGSKIPRNTFFGD